MSRTRRRPLVARMGSSTPESRPPGGSVRHRLLAAAAELVDGESGCARAAATLLDADSLDLLQVLVCDMAGEDRDACSRARVLRHLYGSARSLRLGDVVDAEAEARRALIAARAKPWPEMLALAAATLVRALTETDALTEAARVLREVGAAAQLPACPSACPVLFARARLSRLSADPRSALADAHELGAMQQRFGLDGTGHPWRLEAALALHDLGNDDSARRFARLEQASAQAMADSRRCGEALHVLAIASAPIERIELLRQAEAILPRARAPLQRAAVLVDLGAATRRAGNRKNARAWLNKGHTLALACGARALAARAQAELESSCLHLQTSPIDGAQALTPSERRVAELAAQGLSNRQIANTLFVTLKTVEGHLSATYRKLDVRSRHALPDTLAPMSEHPIAV